METLDKNTQLSKGLLQMGKRSTDCQVTESSLKVLMALYIIGKRSGRPLISETARKHSSSINLLHLDRMVKKGLLNREVINNKFNKTFPLYGYDLTDKGRSVHNYILNGGVKPNE
jgi:DNA-binding MarR family transcriptional regulator